MDSYQAHLNMDQGSKNIIKFPVKSTFILAQIQR